MKNFFTLKGTIINVVNFFTHKGYDHKCGKFVS